ncbi:MAG: glycosyl hydrolase [Candidatus Saccharimonadales bacterium]
MKKQTTAKSRKNPGKLPRFWVPIGLFAMVGVALTLQSFAASTASVYYGVFNGGSTSLSDVTAFEQAAQKPVSIVNSFQSWASTSNSFKTDYASAIRAHGSIPMITWEPWDTSQGVNQPGYSLQSIISGQHDAYIKQWARAAKAWGHPYFLRYAHEMNGDWYPWAGSSNGNSPDQYVAAWRHVHQIFTSVGANNATWVWCPNKIYTGGVDLASLYPGDKYVDWVAFDAYNRGTAPGLSGNQYGSGSWQTFAQLAKPTYTSLLAIAPGKPVMVAETGTVEDGGSKADWFTKALKYELKANYPRIKAFVYFNLNKVYDNRINSSPTSLAAFVEGIGLSYYATNDFAGLKVSPIQPLLNDATTADVMGPFVKIAQPVKDSLPQAKQIGFSAKAVDKSGIGRVEFYVDSQLVCSDSKAAYQCAWTTPSQPGSFKLTVVAYDKAGNSATSTADFTVK